MNYEVKLQKTRAGKVCICIVSTANGKLVLKGESLHRMVDAKKVGGAINTALGNPEVLLDVLPFNHRWPVNAGGRKKAPIKA
jgi:hypothetical protein